MSIGRGIAPVFRKSDHCLQPSTHPAVTGLPEEGGGVVGAGRGGVGWGGDEGPPNLQF